MGNTATKEARPYGPSPRYSHVRGASNVSNNGDQAQQHGAESSHHGGSSRQRGNRPDLSLLGFTSADTDRLAGEHRRETRQEREARKLEKERVARVKERERSMKEEHVDGGYLVTQGVYVGTEDFSKPVVRQLMIDRKLAPFWKGLNDFSDSWAEHQLMAAARGLPIPPPDEVPPELEYRITSKSPDERAAAEKNLNNLTVPISSRSQSFNSDSSSTRPKSPSVPPPHTPSSPGSSTTHLFRGRAKTLASLTTKTSSSDMAPREFQLPPDPFVNGQPIEAYLYKAASECPICFLYYPPYLNRTRCCDQPICSECFVQIKRPDPHPPEHEQPDGSTPTPSNNDPNQTEGQLVSEPAACPFCVQPEFGVTYASPPFRRGLTYAASYTHPLAHAASPASSSSSLVSGNASPQPGVTRRRATSLSANSPGVITTDKIRPDWAHKLATARAHAARRSAAATALHTAAYLMNSPSNEGRNFGGVSRRAMLRRAAGQGSESPGSRPGYLNTLQTAGDNRRANQLERENSGNNDEDATNLAPPRASSRRTRMDELEDMMMMEAIRLSLAAEEERRKKQEKEARKDAKKREKETKKAEKYARKNGLYSNNPSNVALNTPSSRTPPVRVDSGSSSVATEEPSASKGKEVERPADSSPSPASSSSEPPKLSLGKLDDGQPSSPLFAPSQAEPSKKSHLRHASSASSSNSSLIESTSGENIGDGTPPRCAGSSAEPMFNFRSLAEVIGDEDKDSTEHVEHTTQAQARASVQQGPVPVEQACSTLGSELAPKEAPELRIGNGSSDNKRHDDTIDQKELQPRSVEVTPNSAQDLEASG